MRLKLRLAAVATIAIAVAACGGSTATTGGPGTSGGATTTEGNATGGTVRIGYGGSPKTLNPGLGVLVEDYIFYDLVYDSVMNIDLNGNFVPELATAWTPSEDGLTWTLTIRDDATFHDGTPLTAEDVAFSISMWRDPSFLCPETTTTRIDPDTGDTISGRCGYPWIYLGSYVDVFTSVEAPDATTVVLTTDEPLAAFEYRMPPMYVVPKHIWEAVGDPTRFDNAEMIGSGPFKLVENQQDQFVRLAANEDYYAGAPHVDEAIFQTYDNQDALVQGLINGDVDMISEFPFTAIPTLRNTANVVVASGSNFGGRFADIYFNVVDPANCPAGSACSGHPALRDVRVRQALATATDKQALIDVALLGLGEKGLGVVPKALGDWYASELEAEDYQFSIENANQMLEDAGYVDTDGDGIRECPTEDCGPTGDLTFRMSYPTDNVEHPRVSEQLQSWWGQIGVKVEISALDAEALTAICCPGFDYDVILWSWSSDTDPEGLLSVILCSEIETGFNETGYCNPEYDALYDQQTVEQDHEARVQMVHDMQRMTLEEALYIIPWYYPSVMAYRSDTFTGWQDTFPIVSLYDPSSMTVIRPAG
jgi:peptide/nickel transport system substrate-binding protein